MMQPYNRATLVIVVSVFFSAGPVIDAVLKEFDCPEDVLIRCTVGTRQM